MDDKKEDLCRVSRRHPPIYPKSTETTGIQGSHRSPASPAVRWSNKLRTAVEPKGGRTKGNKYLWSSRIRIPRSQPLWKPLSVLRTLAAPHRRGATVRCVQIGYVLGPPSSLGHITKRAEASVARQPRFIPGRVTGVGPRVQSAQSERDRATPLAQLST